MPTLWAASLVSHKTREGRVDLADVGEDGATRWQTQCSVAEARAFAFSILEAAEAAETDALLWEWSTDDLGVSESGALKLLRAVRELRDKRRGKT